MLEVKIKWPNKFSTSTTINDSHGESNWKLLKEGEFLQKNRILTFLLKYIEEEKISEMDSS